MKKIAALLLPLLIISCGEQAMVEVGLSDELYGDATLGDIVMRVTRIELPEDTTYNTIWEGAKLVEVEIQGSEFASITDDYIEISPGSYRSIRLTVDSIRYAGETTVMLVESSYQFIAETFASFPIEIDDGAEICLIVIIASQNWFDVNSQQLIEGHEPFEGAFLTYE